MSEPFSYDKQISFTNDTGHLFWMLASDVSKLEINNNFTIKRIEPFTQADHDAIEQMLDQGTADVKPSTVKA